MRHPQVVLLVNLCGRTPISIERENPGGHAAFLLRLRDLESGQTIHQLQRYTGHFIWKRLKQR